MNTYSDTKARREGAAVFTVLGVILLISMALSISLKASSQRIFLARKLADRVKAVACAEAGVDHAYSILATNFSLRTNSTLFPHTTLEDGSYYVRVLTVSNDTVVLVSTGYCGSVEAQVVVDLKNYGGSGIEAEEARWWDSDAFDYAMICGGLFTYRGCGTVAGQTNTALAHSNSTLDMRGDVDAQINFSSSTLLKAGNIDVDGSATAPSLDLHNHATFDDGAHEEAVPVVDIPNIDLTPWYNEASANDEVKEGDWSTSSDYTPDGGILWVNGNVTISSHATINGQIIATGNITVSGHVKVNAAGDFAMVSRDGNINNTSSGTIKGLIYAKTGNYSQTANGNHEGQLIVKGSIYKGGCSDVLLMAETIPTPPGGFPGSEGTPEEELIGVSAWQQ